MIFFSLTVPFDIILKLAVGYKNLNLNLSGPKLLLKPLSLADWFHLRVQKLITKINQFLEMLLTKFLR